MTNNNDFFQHRIWISWLETDISKLRILIIDCVRCGKKLRPLTKGYLWRDDSEHIFIRAIENRFDPRHWEPFLIFLTQTLQCHRFNKIKSVKKLPLLKSEIKSLFYFPKISITTYITRHIAWTINQANHGHCEGIFGNIVTKIQRRGEEAHWVITFIVDDYLYPYKGERE